MRTSLSVTLAAALLAAPLVGVSPAQAAEPPTRITLTRWTDKADFRTGPSPRVSRCTGGKLVLGRRGELAPGGVRRPVRRRHGAQDYEVRHLDVAGRRARLPRRRGDLVVERASRRPARGWRRCSAAGTPTGRGPRGTSWVGGPPAATTPRATSTARRCDGQGDTDARVLTDTFTHPLGPRTGGLPDPGERCCVRPARRATPHARRDHHHDQRADPGVRRAPARSRSGGRWSWPCRRTRRTSTPASTPSTAAAARSGARPTSTAMVMRYFGAHHSPSTADLAGIVAPNGDPQVDHAAMQRLGLHLRGRGQLAVQRGVRAHATASTSFVTRLRSLAGGRAVRRGRHPGHHLAVVGARGDAGGGLRHQRAPARDHRASPRRATRSSTTRRRTRTTTCAASTRRENFEKVWQESTGGVAYIYHPNAQAAALPPCPARRPTGSPKKLSAGANFSPTPGICSGDGTGGTVPQTLTAQQAASARTPGGRDLPGVRISQADDVGASIHPGGTMNSSNQVPRPHRRRGQRRARHRRRGIRRRPAGRQRGPRAGQRTTPSTARAWTTSR